MCNFSVKDSNNFHDVISIAINFFKNEIEYIDLETFYANSSGKSLTGFEWCLEMLNHLSHHRGQIYTNAVFYGCKPSKELNKKLFKGHVN